MHKPALAAAVACAVVVLAAPASAAPGLETVIQDDSSFLHRSPADVAKAMARSRKLGVDRVRLTASWSSLTRDADSETKPAFEATDPAAYEQDRWAALDGAVRAAHDAGLAVMIDIGFWAPRWATSDAGPRARTNVDAGEFAAFAMAVARRYNGGFRVPAGAAASPPSQDQSLLDQILGEPPPGDAPQPQSGAALPRVDLFTLWNEPNHPAFLLPQWSGSGTDLKPVSPGRYRLMVQAAFTAIKTVVPDDRVLIGNTSSVGRAGLTDPVPPLRFVRELACVDHDLRPITTGDCAAFKRVPGDGFAHHPYSLTGAPGAISKGVKADNVRIADLPKLARLLRRLVTKGRIAPGLASIYITEYGYETQPLPGRAPVSEAKQARYLTWAEYLASRVKQVKMFAQFLLRDQPPASAAVSDSVNRPLGQFASGLETVDGKAKLASRSFVAGLFARPARHGATALFGRLRLKPGVVLLRIVVRGRSGAWRVLRTSSSPGRPPTGSFRAAGHGSFLRYARAPRAKLFRLDRATAPGRWRKGPVPVPGRP